MSVSLSRRFALLPAIVIASIGFRCATYQTPPQTRLPACSHPSGNYWNPVICIDETTLTASPNSTLASDVEPNGLLRTRSTRPVIITWLSQGGSSDWYVKFDQVAADGSNTCTEKPRCAGGRCRAMVKRIDPDEHGQRASRRCTYQMFRGQQVDAPADIVINPCCW